MLWSTLLEVGSFHKEVREETLETTVLETMLAPSWHAASLIEP